MRVFWVVLVTAIFLQACSPPGGTEVPQGTPTPVDTSTPTIPPTSTQTLTPTASPTIVRFPTEDPNATPTLVPTLALPSGTVIHTATPIPTATPSGPGPGFVSVTLSENKLYWGICKPNSVKITAEVEDPENVYNVVLFWRLKDMKEEDYTPWNTGAAMDDRGEGIWTYLLRTKTIHGRNHYFRSWIQYQIVATDIDGNFIGRTWVFLQAMSLQPCM